MTEDDEQKLLVRRILRNGRRRYDLASKERLVAACLEPGVSVSRLALEHGIKIDGRQVPMATPGYGGGDAFDRAAPLDTRRRRYRRDGPPSGAAIPDRRLTALDVCG